jgi:rhodanese-related sulfurtransferase
MLHAKMLLAQAFPSIAPSPSNLLLDWRNYIKRKFSRVQHIPCHDLHAWLQGGGAPHPPPLLLDFRTQSEFSCSRIAGSVRVDPDASVADVLALLQGHDVAVSSASKSPFSIPQLPQLADTRCERFAVFYCSIGYRSSAAAARVLQSEVNCLRLFQIIPLLTTRSPRRQFAI